MSGAPPEIRLAALGPVQVFRDGVEVELPGRRPRLMLALLLARADQTVSVTELIALLWVDELPANAVNMLHRYVGLIRRTLQPGLRFRAEGRWLYGVPGGYRLPASRRPGQLRRAGIPRSRRTGDRRHPRGRDCPPSRHRR